MENNELCNSPELDQLRAEYTILKNKFSQQEVINDRLIRETMKQRVKGINNISFLSSLCAVFVIIVSPFVFHENPVINASWAFVIATMVMMLVCIFFNWKHNRRLNDADVSCCDLKEFAKSVQYTRKKWREWRKVAVPMVVVWLCWLFAEVWMNFDQKEIAIFMIAGLVVGALVGGLVESRMNWKAVDYCDEILSQIDN